MPDGFSPNEPDSSTPLTAQPTPPEIQALEDKLAENDRPSPRLAPVWIAFGASIGFTALAFLVLRPRVVTSPLLALAATSSATGMVLAVRALWIRRKLGLRDGVITGGLGLAVVAHGVMAFFGAVAALLSTMSFGRGRQLRSFGRVLLPRVEIGTSWTTRTVDVDVPDSVRPALAAQWRENGRTEHASVAAFARLTLDLMALGAPPALVKDAQTDALEEIRHAEMCFSLARALDGTSASPGAFPEAQNARTLPKQRTLALATLAVDSLVDGALHEGVSAAVVAKLARRCEVPAIREILLEIARDEGRHAAHGWDVVLFCVDRGGAPVIAALEGAIAKISTTMKSDLPEVARSGAWERYGIMGAELEATEYARMRAMLASRVTDLSRTAKAA